MAGACPVGFGGIAQVGAVGRCDEARRHQDVFARLSAFVSNPRIVRDPFRVDFEGEFRLAPLPRLSVRGRRGVILSDGPDYNYDAMRRVQFRGVRSVAVVWPCEFYAAMRLKRRPARPKPIVERARKPARTDRPALPVSLLQPVPKPVLNPMLYAPP